MRVVKTSYMNPDKSVIEEAVSIMKECGLVVGITDTVYGLFTNPLSRECVERVYQAKERVGKPIPILVSSVEKVLATSKSVDKRIECFMRLVWPGPVTIVLPIKEGFFPENVHLGTNKVGFRLPAAPLPVLLADRLGGYLTGTSANISGLPSPRTIEESIKQLGERIDLYIDSGIAPLGTPSTVIEVVNNTIKVIRRGVISEDVIKSLWMMCSSE